VKTPFNLVKGGLPYKPTPLTIKEKKGSMISASDGQRSVTRNSSFFKRIQSDPNVGIARDYDTACDRDEDLYERSSLDRTVSQSSVPNQLPHVKAIPQTPVKVTIHHVSIKVGQCLTFLGDRTGTGRPR
jgi:hypothetical protein